MSLSSLPVEILALILTQIDDAESLKSTVLSCRLFHSAYEEHKKSIHHALWTNTYADCEMYCRFLTHAIINFLPSISSGDPIQGPDMLDFFAAYINWANPPEPAAPDLFQELPGTASLLDSATIPTPSSKDMAETHKYIFSWTKKFCTERLKCHAFTKEETSTNPPPTRAEITRICAAFYQLWIFCLLFNPPVVGIGKCFEDQEVDMPHEWDDGLTMGKIIHAIAESIGYRDFVVIRNSLMVFFMDCAKGVMGRIQTDERYLEMCRKRPDQYIAVDISQQHTPILETDEAPMWSIACRLGPKGYWRFLFESTWEEQLATSLTHNPTGVHHDLREIFEMFTHDDFKTEYCPILRICRDRYELVRPDFEWWAIECDDDKVDASVVMWDDWRLKEWGFRFPDFFRGLPVGGHFAEWEISLAYEDAFGEFVYIFEKSKQTRWRDSLFRRADANLLSIY
ncbi:hypothetical protein TWF281_002189 [Arthrobotrys megalospora]